MKTLTEYVETIILTDPLLNGSETIKKALELAKLGKRNDFSALLELHRLWTSTAEYRIAGVVLALYDAVTLERIGITLEDSTLANGHLRTYLDDLTVNGFRIRIHERIGT